MATFCRLDFITINTYARFYVRQYGHINTVSNRAGKFSACFHLIFRCLFSIMMVSVALYRISHCTKKGDA